MPDLATLRKETRAALCLSCGKCSTMCPLSTSGWFSAARMAALRDADTEIADQARPLDACLTCGSCEIRCPEGVRFVDFVRGVRTLAPKHQKHPCPHGEALQATARLMAGPRVPSRDLSWVSDDLEIVDQGEVALFVGCLPFYDVIFEKELGLSTLEIARSAIRLLNRVGIRPIVISEERCCGHDLLWNGESDAFSSLAAANTAEYRQRGAKRILTTCAECCRTWRIDYATLHPEYRPEVEHFSEFLAARLESGELEPVGENGKHVTYHDPCRLGRHLGITDAPRTVLRSLPGGDPDGAGSAFVDMEKSGTDAVCCGTSGFLHCDANSRRLQSKRLASAEATGAEVMATACPKCLIHFRCAQSEDRRRERKGAAIDIQDLTVLAASKLHRPATQQTQDLREENIQVTRGEAS